MVRPLIQLGIAELELAFERRSGDPDFVRALLDELGHRRRAQDRVGALRDKALHVIAKLAVASPAAVCADEPRLEDGVVVTPPPVTEPPVPPGASPPFPTISNAPTEILAAWTALEVLSPASYRRPEDLAGGDRRAVATLTGRKLPWDGDGEKARPSTRLYYQVILGSIDLTAAFERLSAVYGDARPERPTARGRAALAALVVDRAGRPVEEPAAAVASFGWGLPIALTGDLRGLSAWPDHEQRLAQGLDAQLRKLDAAGNPLPIDREAIRQAFVWMTRLLRLPSDLVHPPEFAVRIFEYYKNSDPPDPLILNSFFLNDLAAAAALFHAGAATANLRRYVGVQHHTARRDLLTDQEALADAVAPARFPPGRWPGPGRHPLVLLQQAAVNLATSELRDDGILAVNGPPGTGKTTLLRDIVAALVTERARIMAGFDDPAAAFSNAGERLKAGQGWLHLYRVDPRLRGFEMVVASSNNRAVENVSAELPGIAAIATDADALRYLPTLSNALLDRDTWGLAAAVLGNATNRARFRQTFWWDTEVGLATYLAEAAGTPQLVEDRHSETGKVCTRPPRIVTAEQPPKGHAAALARWQIARQSFRTALARSEALLGEAEAARRSAAELPGLIAAAAAARRKMDEATERATQSVADAAITARASEDAARKLSSARNALGRLRSERPALVARIFRTASFRVWREGLRVVAMEEATANRAAAEAQVVLTVARRARDAAAAAASAASATDQRAAADLLNAREKLAVAAKRFGANAVDVAFLEQEHAIRHRAAPWFDAAANRLRDDVFVAAMALHRAFLDAAAKPLRHNLGALMQVFGRRPLVGAAKEALLPDLWASLFLVVPAVSTTFASVERMMGTLPPESLGWLLIDEAGQALPQAAIGALMRTQRAVIVGDPMQIEPVVVLPPSLTGAICRSFGVDPDRYDAPAASAQTLADDATPFVAEFSGKHGSRIVGVPLLVHRRCEEPMFGIANAIAYDRLMVQAKAPSASPIRDLLGPSRWFDVSGSAEEKWCPQEGALVADLLSQLVRAGVTPDLYVVTPFVVIQDNLRRLIYDRRILGEIDQHSAAWVRTRIGTVHTVQGREAEAVLFVLGAAAVQQNGARGWAGGQPNLLNVAVTRAKEAIYVVGNRRLWRAAGVFAELDARLP